MIYLKYFKLFESNMIIGKLYNYDELSSEVQSDIDIQFEDNLEESVYDYQWEYKLLSSEDLEEYVISHFGEYEIQDVIDEPYMKSLINDIRKNGVRNPSVGIEGNHRALACWYLKVDLPYLNPIRKEESIYESRVLDISSLSDIKPETLEDQIKFSMKWYPSLYGPKYGRIRVLCHMFLGYGTEYEWDDWGRLTNAYFESESEMLKRAYFNWDKDRNNMRHEIKRNTEHWHVINDMCKRNGGFEKSGLGRIQKDISDLEEMVDDFNVWFYRYAGNESKLDSINYSEQYSPIFNIPDNIDPEYLEGAKEIVSYILENFKDKKIQEDFSRLNESLKKFK